jgi:hypothetical protein
MKRDLSKLMEGLEIKVSQGRNGRWYAYVAAPHAWGNVFGQYAMEDPGKNWWKDASGDTEDEAREKACQLAGVAFGNRLAQALAPIAVPAKVIPAPSQVTL